MGNNQSNASALMKICSPNHENVTSSLSNIQNEEPVNLSNRIRHEFKRSIIASKDIMTEKRNYSTTETRHIDHPMRNQSRHQTVDIGNITMTLEEKLFAPVFQVFARMKLKKPAFQMLQINPKKFVKLKQTSIAQDYQLISELGKGGFGSVYKARQKRTNQLRAIKKIKKEALDQEQRLSLMNEFQILSEMDHPNIIKLYDIYDGKSNFYVVTQLCQGGNLLTYVNKVKISQSVMKDVMTQLLSAVKYMHNFKYLHRDIKLENIVLVKKVTNQNQKMQIKLIDFGISLNLKKSNLNFEPIGTLLYMSPQSLNDSLELASDLWSCGIALYMMATRKLPYFYRSDEQLMQRIKKGEFIRKNMQSLSVELKILIIRLLQKNYKTRISAAHALEFAWMKKQMQRMNISHSKMVKAAKNLMDYDAKNNLISIIQSYIVFKKINQDERQRLALIFQQIDKDKSGIIQINQLKHFYSDNSEHYDPQEVQQLLRVMDKNKSGKIDFNEFIVAMHNRRQLFQLQSLEEAFDYFDKDKSGEISKKQLQEILEGIKHDQVQYLFAELDKNSDEKISKSQFIAYLTKYSKNQDNV